MRASFPARALSLALLACSGTPAPTPVRAGRAALPTVAADPAVLPVSAPRLPSTAARTGPCHAVCERSAPLRCPAGSECLARCEEMRASPVCPVQLAAVLRCFGTVPTARWECGEDGLPAVKDGECEPEQAAFAACFAAAGAAPRPAGGTGHAL